METLKKISECLLTMAFVRLFREVGEYVGRQSYILRQQPEILDALRQIALLDSVRFGNSLGSSGTEKSRVQKIVQQGERPVTPVERKLAGYNDVLGMVVQPAEHTDLSVDMICHLHTMLYSHCPDQSGGWRMTNKAFIDRDATGRRAGMLYRTPYAVEVPDAMKRTMDLYHQQLQDGVEPLLVIACTTLDLLCIQPFCDDNERIVFLLTILLLELHGYEVCRFVSFEKIIMMNREAYIAALQKSMRGWQSGSHNPLPWIEFFLNSIISAYQELESRVNHLTFQGGRAPKSQLIETVIYQKKQDFSVAEINSELPTVSRELIKKVILKMRDEGYLKPIGKGRGARWKMLLS